MELSTRKLALAALLAPLVAGCTPNSPRTVFDWGVNDRLPRHVARNDARPYADRHVPVPTPRPNYVAAAAPLHRKAHRAADYTQYSLPALPRSTPTYDGRAPIAFVWPVNGTVISDFGSTDNGGRNDGINIATGMDAPIRAAAGGTVTYSGNELKDYGNLVLIRHAGGYVTAYAHADRLLVSRGDVVAKGQVIGYAGTTGDVSRPQLHFEIRHDTAPVNPLPLLASARYS
jgi:murein DD-endopeptidase MepM/ murein hydrolase activator NlpD